MPATNIERQSGELFSPGENESETNRDSDDQGYAPLRECSESTVDPRLQEAVAARDRKVAIRREVRAALKRLRGRKRRSQTIGESIMSHRSWQKAKVVAVFAPMASEPDIELLWPHATGKTICYPTIRLGGLDFLSVPDVSEVVEGPYGFREPAFDASRVVPAEQFDLVLVPGAAFTVNGDRLGRGGGFYDRLLSAAGFRAATIGVCFDLQVYEDLPVEPHDQLVSGLVTESGWRKKL